MSRRIFHRKSNRAKVSTNLRKVLPRRPGDLEICIRPDGRVCVAVADEAMLDVCQALDPDNPVLVKRRKGKSKNG
jgi:hypothetical protein